MNLLLRCVLILNICLASGFYFTGNSYSNTENIGPSEASMLNTSHSVKSLATPNVYNEGQSQSEDNDCCQDCFDCSTCCCSFLNINSSSLKIVLRKISVLNTFEFIFKSTYLLEVYKPPISLV